VNVPCTKYKREVADKITEQILHAVEPAGTLVTKTDGPTAAAVPGVEVQPERSEAPEGHPVRGDSLAATLFGVERESVLREMHRVHVRMVLFYTSPEGGSLSLEEAVKTASNFHDDGTVEEQLDKILRMPVENVSWYAVNKLCGSSPEWVLARRQREHSFPRDRSEMRGYWDPPYASEQEAVEHAAQMADRYSRAFQRTLRAMRDLRRYSAPVNINNPQQVNIAADGGQQVNVAKN